MRADFAVCIDACVLANFGVCDLFLRLAERPRLYIPRWSDDILAEVKRTHINRLNWPKEIAESYQKEIRIAFPDASVRGYEPLIPTLTNHEKDRHVLAAAIKGRCSLIVTFNLKDFPEASTKPWDICVVHPQDYLITLHEMGANKMISCLGEIAGRKGIEVEDLLIHLGKSVPLFSSRMLDELVY